MNLKRALRRNHGHASNASVTPPLEVHTATTYAPGQRSGMTLVVMRNGQEFPNRLLGDGTLLPMRTLLDARAVEAFLAEVCSAQRLDAFDSQAWG